MIDELKIDTTLPVIVDNFTVVEQQLKDGLKQYELLVDQDSLKTAKSMATDLRKISTTIDTLRKSKVGEMSAPIKEFETKAKQLTALVQESRQKLLSQIKVFDDKQVTICSDFLNQELKSQYDKLELKEEFRTVTVQDLAIISNLTKTYISKKAITAIADRVLEAKKFQDKIDTRLLTLETICLKAGLQSPLTRENINHFLMENNDDVYLDKLTSLIQNEFTRIELAIEQKKIRDAAQAIKPQIEKPKTVEKPKSIKELQKEANTKPSNNVRTFIVNAAFEIEVDESLELRLEAMLLKKFKDGGFKVTPTISIHKEEIRKAS